MLKSILLSAVVMFISLGAFADFSVTLISTDGGDLSPVAGNTYTLAPAQNPFNVSVQDEHAGYVFSHWEMDGSTIGYLHDLSVTITQDVTIKAVFVEGYHLTISVLGQGTIAFTGNTATLGPVEYGLPAGTQQTISATPDAGYKALRAIIDEGLATGYTITYSQPYEPGPSDPVAVVTPVFTSGDHTVKVIFTINATMVHQGTGQTEPAEGSYQYCDPQQLAPSAFDVPGSVLTQWLVNTGSGPVAEGNAYVPAAFPVSKDATVTAVFEAGYKLVIATHGTGTIDPAPNTYGYALTNPATVNINATATAGTTACTDPWIVSAAVDGIDSTTSPTWTTSVVMDQDHTVDVVFSTNVTVDIQGASGILADGNPIPSGCYSISMPSSHMDWDPSNTPAGSVLTHWILNGQDLGNTVPFDLSFPGDSVLVVQFEPGNYVTVDPIVGPGTVSPEPGVHGYAANTPVLITGTPNLYHFIKRMVIDGSLAGDFDSSVPFSIGPVLIAESHEVGFVFSDYVLSIPASDGGICIVTDTPAPFPSESYSSPKPGGLYPEVADETISIQAIADTTNPARPFRFDHWTTTDINNGATQNPLPFSSNTDTMVTAVFVATHTLTVDIPEGQGLVDPSPGAHVYDEGTPVQVTATPGPGQMLAGWNIDGTTTPAQSFVPASYVITMDSDHSIHPVFSVFYTLTTAVSGDGGITPPPGAYPFKAGETQLISASANAGSVFDHWVAVPGGVSTDPAPWTWTANTNTLVTAYFAPATTVTLTYTAGANGTIEGPASQTVALGGDGTAVTAVANTGYYFVNWSDGASLNPRTDTHVTANVSVTANFAVAGTLTLTYTAGANGSITGPTPQTVNSGADGMAVTAVPNPSYHFVNWSDGSTANPRTDTRVTADVTVTANFSAQSEGIVTATVTSGMLSVPATAPIAGQVDVTLVNELQTTFSHVLVAGIRDPVTGAFEAGTTPVVVLDKVPPSPGDYLYSAQPITLPTIAVDTPQTYSVWLYDAVMPPGDEAANETAAIAAFEAASVTANDFYNVKLRDVTVDPSYQLTTMVIDNVGGALAPASGPQVRGNTVTLTATPDFADGYYVQLWTGTNDNTSTARTNAVTMTAPKLVTVTFANTYTLTVSVAGDGGTVGPTSGVYTYGDVATLVATPADSCHQVTQWSSNTGTITPVTATQATIPITGNTNVSVEFGLIPYTLTYTPANANGTIVGPSPQTVGCGQDGTAVTAVPMPGYHFTMWGDASIANPRTDLNVTANVNAKAYFVAVQYILAYTAGPGGSITPSNLATQSVAIGSNGAAVTALPNAHFHFVSWSDGSTQNPRQDLGVTQNISVSATFAINTYTLTYAAGANGLVEGALAQTVNYGGSGTAVTAVPAATYRFVNWSDGKTDNPRTDAGVTANFNVSANFGPGAFTVTYLAGANGSIVGPASQTVNFGESSTAVTAVPATNYGFLQWNDGSTQNPRIDTNVTAAITVTAVFYGVTFTTAVSPSGAGTVTSPVSGGTYPAGQVVTFSATANAGYKFSHWDTGSQNPTLTGNPATATLDFNWPANIMVTAVFTQVYTLTLTSSPAAGCTFTVLGANLVPDSNPAQYTCDPAAKVTAFEIPNTGYSFLNWTGDLTGTSNFIVIQSMSSNVSLTANFNVATYTLTPTVSPAGKGTITLDPPGTGSPPAYAYGTLVNLVAVADTYYKFDHWSGDTADITTPDPKIPEAIQVTMTGNIPLTANFISPPVSLTVNYDPSGVPLNVTQTPAGPYLYGMEVTLTAYNDPADNYYFVNWVGNVASTTDNPTTIELTAAETVTAHYEKRYPLTTTASPPAGGTISTSPPGNLYVPSSSVTATATANPGYKFDHWTGDVGTADITNPSITLTMDAPKALTANFTVVTYTLTLNYSPASPSPGVVTASPSQNPYAYNTAVVLTATPNVGYVFDHWSGDITGIANPTSSRVTLVMDANKTLTANFVLQTVTLTITAPVNGTVTGAGAYPYGTLVSITATPDQGYAFGGWSGPVTDPSVASTTIMMTSNQTITATFTQITYQLITVTSPTNKGTVTASPPGPYLPGVTVQVTANPVAGYRFDHWSGNVLDSDAHNNPLTVTMDSTKALTANFVQIQLTLTINLLPSSAAGTVVPASGTTYQLNQYVQMQAYANPGYSFDHWEWDSTQTKANPTSIQMTGDKTVTAVFLSPHTLTYAAGANGTITGVLSQTVNYGGSGTAVTATAGSGYHFVNWSDGSTQNPRTDTNVTANINVTANFAVNGVYTLTYAAGANGTVTGTLSQTVNYGGSATAVTATADTGYHFVNWSDGSTQNPRVDVNVSADISVVANFASNQYTLTYTAGAHGTLSGGAASQTVNYGGSGTAVTANADTGYHFVNWSDGLTANPRTDTNVLANLTVTATFAINQYTLTYTVDAHGTLSGAASQTVNYGGSGTAVTAVANPGYQFVRWSDGLTTAARTDTNVTADMTADASFVAQFLLTYTAGAHGTISGAASQTIIYGGNGTAVTANADTGYHFVNWSDNSTQNPRTDANVTQSVTVSAAFAIDQETLTYTAGANGTITGTASQTVSYGASGTAVTAVPNTGYHFVNWSDGSTQNPRTDANVTANISVTAHFDVSVAHTLTYQTDGNGTITGALSQTVNYGGSGTAVTAVPNTGYHFVNWSDGSTQNPRTDTNVTANITVTATFMANGQYKLTYTAGANGTIIGTSPQTVNYGASGTPVTAAPSTGYHFVSWSDGSTQNPRTDAHVAADVTVTASFAINQYALTYATDGHGTITGAASQTVNYGGSGTAVTAVANGSYHFVKWSDGSTANPRTDTNVTANVTATATFAINMYSLVLAVSPSGSGTVLPNPAPDGSGKYSAGAVVVLSATPTNDGYKFDHWTGGTVAADNTVTMNSDMTITAVFTINTYKLTYLAGANGTISGALSQTVSYGGSGTAVTAVANTGYQFTSWSDNSTVNPRTDANVTKDIPVTANFVAQTFSLTVSASPTDSGTVAANPPSTDKYAANSTVTLTATPSANYVFDHWQGDLSGSTNPAQITMSANRNVTAVFVKPTYKLTLAATPLNGGTISSNPQQTTYQSGDKVTLTAVAADGYMFTQWDGGVTGSTNPATLTMDADKTVTAEFTKTYVLITAIQPAGAGSVSLNPSQGPYVTGSVVTLTPAAAPGYTFSHWEGSLTGSAGPAQLTMDANKSVTAVFDAQQYALTTAASPTEGGSVSASPSGPYVYGTQVTLTATAQPGYTFASWQGDAAGTTNPLTIIMNGNTNVSATFTHLGNVLTVAASPQNGGSVTLDPANGPYAAGTSVTLTPNPASGYLFDHWEGDVQGTATPATIVMDANKSVTAVFLTSSCTLGGFARTFPPDGSTIYFETGAEAAALVVTATPDCPDDTTAVTFQLGSLETTVSTPDSEQSYSAIAGTLGDLGVGSHTLTISATGKFHSSVTVQSTVTFTITQRDATSDANNNGLPDDVFGLLNPGDSWYSVITDSVSGAQRISVVSRWDRTGKAADTYVPSISVQDPEDPGAFVTLTASPDLLTTGQSAVLILRTAPDLTTLYGTAGASVFGADPGALVQGAKYMDVTVATSIDGGKTYGEIPAAQVAANPMHITISGLQFASDATPSLYSHPSHVQDDPSTGLDIMPWQGDWTTTGVAGLVRKDTVMDADLTSLSTFAVFDTSVGAAQITVTPTTYAFSFVQIGSSATEDFVVKNTADAGSGNLIGEASVSGSPAFTMAADGSYDLAPGESKTITITFTPTGTDAVAGSIAFTGAGGTTVGLSGTGYKETNPSCFGLGLENTPTSGLGSARGDLLLLALVSMVLAIVGRKTIRKRERIL